MMPIVSQHSAGQDIMHQKIRCVTVTNNNSCIGRACYRETNQTRVYRTVAGKGKIKELYLGVKRILCLGCQKSLVFC